MTDQHDARDEPMRSHVEGFAARCGWEKNSGEGAFEFVQRKCYHQGWQDGRREALGDVHRDTPEVAACIYKAMLNAAPLPPVPGQEGEQP